MEEDFSPILPCSCGKEAHPATRDFFRRTGPMGIDRAYMTPGILRMVGIVETEISFEKGGAFLKGLAGLSVSPKQVERVAKALGAEMAEPALIQTPWPISLLPLTHQYNAHKQSVIPLKKSHIFHPDCSTRL